MRKFLALPAKCLVMAALVWAVAACHKNPPGPGVIPAAPEAENPSTPGPPECKLTAEPAAISAGQAVTLTWSTANATDISLDPGLGKQAGEGSVTATPNVSTTYIMTATGAGGTATCTARTTVTGGAEQPAGNVSEENLASGAGAGGPWASQLKDVFFDYDSSQLGTDAQLALTTDASIMKAHGDTAFVIEGNCDQRGSEEYNLGLGQRRANAARDYLVNLGVASGGLGTISYGKDKLICTENSEDCWKQNRRDHVRVK